MFRLYRYVGPQEIAERVRTDPMGHAVRSQADLTEAIAVLGGGSRGLLTVTFVVDASGTLRIADRSSEHVACAGGGPVMAAGELGIATGASPSVEEASNQSTGFCPESCSFPALRRAVDDAGIPHPDQWTAAFEFRRCDMCGARTLVKDSYLHCGECGGGLPQRWNFDRTRACRSVVHRESAVWTIDTIEEPSGFDQDRVGIEIRDDHLVVVLADGAGGTSGGAETADQTVAALMSSELQQPTQAVDAIRGLDTMLASQSRGETTAVLADIALNRERRVLGASVGDSVGWARAQGHWTELTEGQQRKPLVGSGRAQPEPFGPHRSMDAMLVASDGLSKYTRHTEVFAAIDAETSDLPWRLVDLARLRSGELQDDVAAVIVRVRDRRAP